MTDKTESNVSDLEQQMAAAAADAVAPAKKGPKAKAADVEAAPVEKSDPDGIKTVQTGGGLSGKKLDITLHTGEGDIGKVDAKVGVNGYVWRIKRNVRVTVPIEVVEVLQNASQEFYSRGDGGREVRSDVPRFPMTVHAQ